MIFYVTIAFILLMNSSCALDSILGKNKGVLITNNVLFFFWGILFIIFGGLRWLTGTDWNSYYPYFIDLYTWKQFNDGRFEIGYALLNFFIKSITPNFTVFLFVQALICVSLKMSVIKKIAIFPGFTLFLYFCYNIGDILAVRQSIAISILMYSILSIQKKDIKQFIMLTFLATCIHNTSIIWIITYRLYWIRLSRKNIYCIFILCFTIVFVISKYYITILNTFVSLLPENIKIFRRISAKIYYYANSYGAITSSFGLFLSFIKRLILLPIFLIVLKRNKNDTVYNGLLNIWIIGTVLYFLFATNLTVFQRLTTPFISVEFLLLPYILKIEKKPYLKPFVFFMISGYAILKLIKALNVYPDLYMPYYTIFNYVPRIMY